MSVTNCTVKNREEVSLFSSDEGTYKIQQNKKSLGFHCTFQNLSNHKVLQKSAILLFKKFHHISFSFPDHH